MKIITPSTLHPLPVPLRHPAATNAFTLVELLTVIAIIGILAALSFVGISKARETAYSASALSNLRTLGLAASLCANDSKGKFPAGYTNIENGGVLSAFQFLDREGYFERRWRQQLFNPAVRRQFSNLVTVDNYLGGYGWNEMDNRWRRYSLDEIAAPPRTIMAADAYFISPNSFDWLLGSVLGFFPNTLSKGSAHYLFYDGHVQKLKAQNPGALNSPPVGYPDAVRFTNQ